MTSRAPGSVGRAGQALVSAVPRGLADTALDVLIELPALRDVTRILTVAVLLAGLTLFPAVSGRRVPRVRAVAAILAVLGVAWFVVFVGALLFF